MQNMAVALRSPALPCFVDIYEILLNSAWKKYAQHKGAVVWKCLGKEERRQECAVGVQTKSTVLNVQPRQRERDFRLQKKCGASTVINKIRHHNNKMRRWGVCTVFLMLRYFKIYSLLMCLIFIPWTQHSYLLSKIKGTKE